MIYKVHPHLNNYLIYTFFQIPITFIRLISLKKGTKIKQIWGNFDLCKAR
jgi:hypothetical protein